MPKQIITPLILWAAAALCSPTIYAQTTVEKGLVNMEVEGISSVIFDMVASPDGSRLYVAALGGRMYAFDATNPQKLVAGWQALKPDLSGWLDVSQDGRYLTLRGGKSMGGRKGFFAGKYGAVHQHTDFVAVLDAANGNPLLRTDDAYSVYVAANKALVSKPNALELYELPSGKLLQSLPSGQFETAALSADGSKLIVSYDATKAEFKQLNEAQGNRREVKTAASAKRQIRVYDVNNLAKPLMASPDEVDLIVGMRADPAGKYLYYIAQSVSAQQAEAGGAGKVLERMDLATGKVDKNFGVRTNDPYGIFRFDADYFMSSDMTGGLFNMDRTVAVRSQANPAVVMADYQMKMKLFKSGTYYQPIALMPSRTMAYVALDKTLLQWDYSLLPHFRRTAMEGGEEGMRDKLYDMLKATLETESDLSKSIAKARLTGNYIMDITVGEKGKVETVFCESDELTHIPTQNALKDLIRKQKFDVEIPKGRRVKFRYVFDL